MVASYYFLQNNLKWAKMIHDFEYLYEPMISWC